MIGVGIFLALPDAAKEALQRTLPLVPDPPRCPLSGVEPHDPQLIDRPAVAIKVVSDPAAFPLSGLEDAEVVFEELIEGGHTRFLALYHCTDSPEVGPVRSARLIDPAIVLPFTRILAFSGANAPVLLDLRRQGIVTIDENTTRGAMERIIRPGASSQHTLFARTAPIRRAGRQQFDRAPADDVLSFGDPPAGGRPVDEIQLRFSPISDTISYRWIRGRWTRFHQQEPVLASSGETIRVDNVIIERHRVRLSKRIADVAGNPSIEIIDVTGSGPALLLRDGQAFTGRWERRVVGAPTRFFTGSGDVMVLREGVTWVELLPAARGDVQGSFELVRS